MEPPGKCSRVTGKHIEKWHTVTSWGLLSVPCSELKDGAPTWGQGLGAFLSQWSSIAQHRDERCCPKQAQQVPQGRQGELCPGTALAGSCCSLELQMCPPLRRALQAGALPWCDHSTVMSRASVLDLTGAPLHHAEGCTKDSLNRGITVPS